MYELVTWFTECPYFNFIASVCSIGSAYAIIKFLRFRSPKPVMKKAHAQKIVNGIVKLSANATDFWFPVDHDDLSKMPELRTSTIDLKHSFQCFPHIDNSRNSQFILISSKNNILLYGTLDFLNSHPRLIANEKTVPELKILINSASRTEDLTDKEFSEQMLRQFEQI